MQSKARDSAAPLFYHIKQKTELG